MTVTGEDGRDLVPFLALHCPAHRGAGPPGVVLTVGRPCRDCRVVRREDAPPAAVRDVPVPRPRPHPDGWPGPS